MQGERGFQGGGSAAGDQDVGGHAISLGAERACVPSGASAGRACGKPAVRRLNSHGWQSARIAAVRSLPCTLLHRRRGPRRSRSRARGPASRRRPRCRSRCSADRDEFVYRPVAVAEPFGFASAQRFSLTRMRGRSRLRSSGREPCARRRADAPPRVALDGEAQSVRRPAARARRARRGGRPRRDHVPRARRTAPGCEPRSSTCTRASRLRVAFVAGHGDGVDAPGVRARADDRPLGAGPRARARAVADHLGGTAADDLRRCGRRLRRRTARRCRRAALDRRVRGVGRGRPASG